MQIHEWQLREFWALSFLTKNVKVQWILLLTRSLFTNFPQLDSILKMKLLPLIAATVTADDCFVCKATVTGNPLIGTSEKPL